MPWTASQVDVLRELGVHWAAAVRTHVRPMDAESQAAAPEEVSRTGEVLKSPVLTPTPATTPALPATETVQSEARRMSAEPVASVLHGLDWAELRRTVSVCQACALCQTRTQTVFGVGDEAAHWMIVGEAPGEQEDLRGEPFVGAAGRLLDQMLAALHLARGRPDATRAPRDREPGVGQVYIANTLKCRPPGNRNPQPEELARCEPFLQRQIALLRPRMILAMGRFAVQSLLRSSEPVGKLRGRVHRYQGVPLIVTYHPAYLLRNPLDKARAWDDLCLAAATYEAQSTAAVPRPAA